MRDMHGLYRNGAQLGCAGRDRPTTLLRSWVMEIGEEASETAGGTESKRRWAAHDENDPVRRIMFGSQEQAESFVENCSGWRVVGEGDPDWRPLPGEPGWTGWPQ